MSEEQRQHITTLVNTNKQVMATYTADRATRQSNTEKSNRIMADRAQVYQELNEFILSEEKQEQNCACTLF